MLRPFARTFVAVQENTDNWPTTTTLLSTLTLRGPFTDDTSTGEGGVVRWDVAAVWTEPGCRRQGIGAAVMEAAAEYAAQKSAVECLLVLEVAADNAAARAFYDWAGFEPAGPGQAGDLRLVRRVHRVVMP